LHCGGKGVLHAVLALEIWRGLLKRREDLGSISYPDVSQIKEP
jgi:hypothetical protein